MIEFEVNPQMISVAAYADTRPLKPIRDVNGKAIEENKVRNSRIVVSISRRE